MRRQAELAADFGAGLARDQHVEAARQLALRLVREALVEPAAIDQAEHPVAEEFQPLIIVACRGCEWVSARSNRARSFGLVAERLARGSRRARSCRWPSKPVAIRSPRSALNQVQGLHTARVPSVDQKIEARRGRSNSRPARSRSRLPATREAAVEAVVAIVAHQEQMARRER